MGQRKCHPSQCFLDQQAVSLSIVKSDMNITHLYSSETRKCQVWESVVNPGDQLSTVEVNNPKTHYVWRNGLAR